ncbi:transcriptional repressor [Goodea atripinnis]|uniref:Transcriptional repressor n=1 Tax=Goodea atripinnis TaxID=208336 RepID=A0ABV0P6G1_9TELE
MTIKVQFPDFQTAISECYPLCLAGFTGHRCEQAVLKKVSDPKQAEELYQKRILTITGICIALLVVGIMCVVAYCKTK